MPRRDATRYAAAAVDATLQRLQSLRLKGRARVEQLAAAWQLGEADARAALEALQDAGLVQETKGLFALTLRGEAQREEQLAAERSALDPALLAELYGAFCGLDGAFKQLVTDVQLGALEAERAPAALADLHAQFAPVAERIGQALPRLASYAGRFDTALEALRGGDGRYLASPLVDSYHTLWFELHEELIQATGRTRQDIG